MCEERRFSLCSVLYCAHLDAMTMLDCCDREGEEQVGRGIVIAGKEQNEKGLDDEGCGN